MCHSWHRIGGTALEEEPHGGMGTRPAELGRCIVNILSSRRLGQHKKTGVRELHLAVLLTSPKGRYIGTQGRARRDTDPACPCRCHSRPTKTEMHTDQEPW